MSKIQVEKWLSTGEFNGDEVDSEEILDTAGTLMDDNCTHEVLGGDVIFKGKDGKFYSVVLETRIEEITEEEATERLTVEDLDEGDEKEYSPDDDGEALMGSDG